MIKLGQLWIAYGVMHQEHHVYLAEGLREGAHDRDAEEIDLEVKRLSVRDFENALLDGTIQDNCTAAAWGLYKIWRERQNV